LGDAKNRESGNESGLTLDSIRDSCERHCADQGLEMDFRQTGDQQALVQWLAEESENFDGLIVNPGEGGEADAEDDGFYAVVMRAVAQFGKPVIEVRLSNDYAAGVRSSPQLHKPECAMGFVCGFGTHSYLLAISAMSQRITAGS